MRRLALRGVLALDFLLAPAAFVAAWLLRQLRRVGVARMPACRQAMLRAGAFPVCRHYYDPQFDGFEIRRPLSQDRVLAGIDWNEAGQLHLLRCMTYGYELADVPTNPPARANDHRSFHFGNGAFEAGDAEYLYQIIRLFKPRRVYEIGSGNSTLIAGRALAHNQVLHPGYTCEHICIEPYEMPWLEQANVSVLRQKVEDVGLEVFAKLEANDLLFIDSSHIIRPDGDVLFEYLELLPALKPGVIVHIHDIFSPKNYLRQWVVEDVRFWNEQYVVEAFLSHNRDWKIVGALNYLNHHHFEALKEVAPFLTAESEPRSLYIQRVS